MTTSAVDLTEREREVLDELLTGKSDNEIATALGIARTSVRAHLKIVALKAQVRGRVALALWYSRHRGQAAA